MAEYINGRWVGRDATPGNIDFQPTFASPTWTAADRAIHVVDPTNPSSLLRDYYVSPDGVTVWYSRESVPTNIGIDDSGAPPASAYAPGGVLAGTRPPVPRGDTADAQQFASASAIIGNALRSLGLDSELDWATGVLRQGLGPDEVLLQLRERPVYKQRFRANEERRKRGLPQLSEGAIVQYESSVRELARRANLPANFWDSTDDFVDMLANDWSPAEVAARINDGYAKVAQVPEVRAVFRQYFGADGDGALASWFLNPARAEPLLMRDVEMARFGGAGSRFGFGIGANVAARAIDRGVSGDQAAQGFEQLAGMRPLFAETITERNNLMAEAEGVSAVFGLDATSADKVRRRQQERSAAFSGSGGAAFTNQGFAGFGQAR